MKKLLIIASFLVNFIFLFIYFTEIKIRSNYPLNYNVESVELDSFTTYEIFSDRDLIPERKKAIEMYREFLSGDRCIGVDDNKIDISHSAKSAPKRDIYSYLLLDDFGEEVWEFSFSKSDSNQNGIYDENDEYFFDGVPVTMETWNALTRRYLFIDLDGSERISDEIEWTVIYESTN